MSEIIKTNMGKNPNLNLNKENQNNWSQLAAPLVYTLLDIIINKRDEQGHYRDGRSIQWPSRVMADWAMM
jgi:hypothetical protein